jgi:peptide/nickel transport system substrate-binding protein
VSHQINRRRALQGGGLLAASLFLAACGGGTPSPVLRAPGEGLGRNDINPKPRDQVRDGGDLLWPIDELPQNLNNNQFDGGSGYVSTVIGPVIASPIMATADGELAPNPDYLTSMRLTSTSPQVVTYTIHPQATWSDRTPITWRDFEAQWKALNGTNPAFLVASTVGYDVIGSVTRGADDKEAVVTYARPLGEWNTLFSPLYPASTNSDPAVFNTGWLNKIPVSAGPFKLDSIDQVAKSATFSRDPRWWGTPAKLDRIIIKQYERTALADALANKEIDFYPIGSSVDLFRRAQSIPDVVVRQSPERLYSHVTFNGAPGSILSDLPVRQAIAKAINREAMATRLLGQITPQPVPLGNTMYPIGTKEYRDNSAALTYDQAAANQMLDAAGWTRPSPGATRTKNGRPLALRLLGDTGNPVNDLINKTLLDQLGQVGATVSITTLDATQWQTALRGGDFDMVGFAWQIGTAPFVGSRGLYENPAGGNVRQNYGRIFSQQILDLFNEGTVELDDVKRAELGNQVDRLIWQEAHHLPLYATPGAYAVRSTLANFGASGFADTDYVNAGFVK